MGFIVMLRMIIVKTVNAQLCRNILSIFAPVRRRKSPHTKRARRGQTSPRSFSFLQLPAGGLLLAADEVGVDAVLLDELVVRAALDDLSAVLILFARQPPLQ